MDPGVSTNPNNTQHIEPSKCDGSGGKCTCRHVNGRPSCVTEPNFSYSPHQTEEQLGSKFPACIFEDEIDFHVCPLLRKGRAIGTQKCLQIIN